MQDEENKIVWNKKIEGRSVQIIEYTGNNNKVDLAGEYRIVMAQGGKKRLGKGKSFGQIWIEKKVEESGIYEYQDTIKITEDEAIIKFTDEACSICEKILDYGDEVVYADINQKIPAHKSCERNAITFIANRLLGGKPKVFK